MGRDWNRLGGHGDESISFSKSKRKANGCMAAFYHLFDSQHFYFPSSHHKLTIDSPTRSKGLILVEESPPSTTYKDKQSLNIPVSMRVKTETGTMSSRLRALATDTSTSSSEICNSPGSKTPSLVARLMGLDLLPEKTDPNLHTMEPSRLTSHRLSKKGGTRSLPESPRVSSARKSDFDIHRLSLQLNRENKHEEFGCSRLKLMKQQDQDQNRSPRDYARQIVKQIKERVVTRRVVVGMDITNSLKNREARPLQNSNELRRDTTITCSPRTRFSDKENRQRTVHKPNSSSSFRPEQTTQKPKTKPTTVILVSVSKASGEKQNQKKAKQKELSLRTINRCKKAESEARFSPRPVKTSPTTENQTTQRQGFLSESTTDRCINPLNKKRSKKIPKSNDLDNISATEPPQKQRNETVGHKSISFSTMHKSKDAATVSASSCIISGGIRIDSEQEYITRIMKLAGINTVSTSTTLDPFIFRQLENSVENQSGPLALRCNRRLLFDLVNEILSEISKRRRNYDKSELIGELCSVVANYQIPGDIASVEFDHLLETKKLEEEEIIGEIERDIIEALVRETASELNFQRRRTETTSERKLGQ